MNEPSSPRRIAPILAGLALVLLGTVAGLGLIELGFRVYHWRQTATAKGFFWEPKPDYGWGLIAGRVAPFYDDKGEFFSSSVRINSQGLRDVEHTYEKPAGVYRILILGDSYMEALQVELEQTFARLLQADLNGSAKQKVEVINTGVSSYGPDNELLFFRSEGYKYEPDLVLLAFTTGNDVRESYEPFNREATGANLSKPNFSLDANGSLQMKPGRPPPPPVPWWRKNFYLGDWLYIRLGGTILLPGGNPFGLAPPLDPRILYVAPDLFVHAPSYRPEVEEAWRVAKALVLELQREVTTRGSTFAVMVNNAPWVHYEDRWRYMTIRHKIAMETWDRQKPRRLIDAFLSEQHIPFIDLYEAFERAKDRDPLYYKWDPHWTVAGHRLAAPAVTEFLRRERLVPVDGSTDGPRPTP
jgi:hypothetical protein